VLEVKLRDEIIEEARGAAGQSLQSSAAKEG
jgi:hypothetical protein